MTKAQKIRRNEIYNKFAKLMDKRENFFKELKIFEEKNGFIPDQYKGDIKMMDAYAEFKRIGGWRKMPTVKIILMKAAKKAMKNERKK